MYYRIAGNFRGTKKFVVEQIFSHFVDNIFVVAACTAGKGRQGRFIRICGLSSNHEYFVPWKLPAIRYIHVLSLLYSATKMIFQGQIEREKIVWRLY